MIAATTPCRLMHFSQSAPACLYLCACPGADFCRVRRRDNLLHFSRVSGLVLADIALTVVFVKPMLNKTQERFMSAINGINGNNINLSALASLGSVGQAVGGIQ